MWKGEVERPLLYPTRLRGSGAAEGEDHEQEPFFEVDLLLLLAHLVQRVAPRQPHAGEKVRQASTRPPDDTDADHQGGLWEDDQRIIL